MAMGPSIRWLRHWGPALLWAVVIGAFSTAAFSAEHTSRFLLPALRWLFPDASPETLALMHLGIRKASHFVEYFILGLLLFRAIRGDRMGWTLRWALLAVALAAGYALVDEVHQLFVVGRGGSAWDVLLDAAGAAVAQAGLWWQIRRNSP